MLDSSASPDFAVDVEASVVDDGPPRLLRLKLGLGRVKDGRTGEDTEFDESEFGAAVVVVVDPRPLVDPNRERLPPIDGYYRKSVTFGEKLRVIKVAFPKNIIILKTRIYNTN